MQLHRLAVCLLLAGAAAPSFAVGRLLDVTILDRDTGASLPMHYHQGEYWVAGAPGNRYAIVLRNRSGERLLAVTAVDGINVLSGETAGWDQTGYVLSPALRYQVTGWRKSNSAVAAFSFSSVEASYAARTGRADHTGVIGVAVFREKRPEPVVRWANPAADHDNRARREDENNARREDDRSSAPPGAPSPSTASGARGLADNLSERAAGPSAESGRDAATGQAKSLAQAAPTPRLGTAHGARETSWVSQTQFARRQAQPDDTIRIRYDSGENLIASGVIRLPASPQPWPRVNPFPASEQATYVPDPPPQRQ